MNIHLEANNSCYSQFYSPLITIAWKKDLQKIELSEDMKL